MGILDRFRQKKEVEKKEKSREELLLDIASAISYGDMEIVSEMEECISDTERYFKNHCEYYEARGIRDAANEDLIQWMTLVDILVQHGYVCELNWKCGRHGFTYFMKQLSTTKSEKLQVIEEWFREMFLNGVICWMNNGKTKACVLRRWKLMEIVIYYFRI